ncbi:MAG: glyoxalase, partial [Bacteroidota bacterium]
MKINVQSIRTFIGSKDFGISRGFYSDLGFGEVRISETLSYFKIGGFGFYLQDYYVKDWVDNLMVFLEVDDLEDLL